MVWDEDKPALMLLLLQNHRGIEYRPASWRTSPLIDAAHLDTEDTKAAIMSVRSNSEQFDNSSVRL